MECNLFMFLKGFWLWSVVRCAVVADSNRFFVCICLLIFPLQILAVVIRNRYWKWEFGFRFNRTHHSKHVSFSWNSNLIYVAYDDINWIAKCNNFSIIWKKNSIPIEVVCVDVMSLIQVNCSIFSSVYICYGIRMCKNFYVVHFAF